MRLTGRVNSKYFEGDDLKITKVFDVYTKSIVDVNSTYRFINKFHFDGSGKLIVDEYLYTTSNTYLNNNCFPFVLTTQVDTNVHYCASETELIANGFIEDPHRLVFFHPVFELTPKTNDRHYSYWMSLQRDYIPFNNCKSKLDFEDSELSDAISMGVVSPSNTITEGKKYTFGVEIETSGGIVPLYRVKDYNLAAMRDGSITGAEYVTGILTGDKGFYHLSKICKLLSTRCQIDSRCSIHVHIGNINLTKETIVAIYLLGLMLENELFLMLPESRRNNEFCRMLSADIASVIPPNSGLNESIISQTKLDIIYHNLFAFVSTESYPNEKVNRRMTHPKGAKCGYNHSTPRYWWLNLVPGLFTREEKYEVVKKHRFDKIKEKNQNINLYSNRTIEFRCHSATLNYEKITNWLKICMSIIFLAENKPIEILERYVDKNNISLEEVIKNAYPQNNTKLLEYIHLRKATFTEKTTELKEYQVKQDENNNLTYRKICV